MKIYIMRHGETEWNRLELIQGRTDIELNQKGRELAAQVGSSLLSVPFTKVITSPLHRAVETAKLALGGRILPTKQDARIQELGFGVLEGKPVFLPNSKKRAPYFEAFFQNPTQYQVPEDGESIEALIGRTGEFLRELEQDETYQNDTILISTHGAASRGMLANMKHTAVKDFWGEGVPPNCSISIAESDGSGWKLLQQDCVFWKEGK